MMRRILAALCAVLIAGPAFGQSLGAQPVGPALVTPTGTTTATAVATLLARSGYYLDDFGASGADSVADDTAMAAVLARCVADAKKTCVIRLGAGNYHLANALVMPTDGNGVDGSYGDSQMTISIFGAGNAADTGATTKNFAVGTTLWLDSQDAAHAGKIVTLGRGKLIFRNLNIRSGGTVVGADVPLLYSTNTNLDIDSTVTFIGQGTNAAPASCTITSDAIVIGKAITGAAHYGTIEASSNQGYDHAINGVNFFNIRHALWARDDVNGQVFNNLKVWSGCSSTTDDAPIVIGTGVSGDTSAISSNKVTADVVEVTNYAYAVHVMTPASGTYVGPVFAFDGTPATVLGAVLLDAGVGNSTVFEGLAPAGKPFLVDNSASGVGRSAGAVFLGRIGTGNRSVLPGFISGPASLPDQIGYLQILGGSGALTVQPDASFAPLSSGTLMEIKRSTGESTDSGASLFAWKNDGSQALGVTAGVGNVTCSLSTCAGRYNNGRGWGFGSGARSSGGSMEIDTGTGGSNLDLKGVLLRFFAQGNTLCGRFSPTEGSTGKPGFDVGTCAAAGSYVAELQLYRADSTHWETNAVMRALGGFQLPTSVVGSLPTCNAAAEGLEYVATDASASTFHSTVAAGGSTHVKVICMSSAWTVGG